MQIVLFPTALVFISHRGSCLRVRVPVYRQMAGLVAVVHMHRGCFDQATSLSLYFLSLVAQVQ